MMPEVPSGLYLAEGFVMTSIFSISLAGSCCKTSARLRPMRAEVRPLMRMRTLSDPRRLTLPSMSTSTEGTFCSKSPAEPAL